MHSSFFSPPLPRGRAVSVALAVLFGAFAPMQAASLHYAGVFGNSGEEGETLVRFAPEPRTGMTVAYDSHGTLWDRAGNGQLNRYALDGRLLESHAFPKTPTNHPWDTLVNDHDTFLFLCNRQLYLREPNDGPDAIPAPLEGIRADYISANVHDGLVAAVNKEEIFLVSTGGEIRHVATPVEGEAVYGIGLGPKGEVYLIGPNRKLRRVDPAASEQERGLINPIGIPIRWIDGYWYGASGHGTLYRFTSDFRSDPGVVLGGNSGSFIGYVPGNYEISDPRGLTRVEGDLFAVSGIEGIVHILQWHPGDKRFEIIRRIGAAQRCTALTLDDEGRLWWESGVWEWNDAPDTPLRHGVPPSDARSYAGSALLKNGTMVSAAIRWKKLQLYYGTFNGPVRISVLTEELPKDPALTAAVRNDRELIIVDRAGNGSRFGIQNNGTPDKPLGKVALRTRTPVREWTSLFSVGDRLIGTADGAVIELAPKDGDWEETDRWNTWGDDGKERFGERIHAAESEGRLWVSDTTRQQVLCFDLAGRKPLAVFGSAGKAGDDTRSLSQPEVIAANHRKAVVYDSGNQRFVKLTFSEE